MTSGTDRLDRPLPATGAPKRWGDLGARAVSAVVLVALALVTTHRGGTPFLLFWLAAAFAIDWEWQRMVGGARPVVRFALGWLTLAAVAATLGRPSASLTLLILVAGALGSAALAGTERRAWAAGGLLYAGLMLLAVVWLRQSFPYGARSILWLFATVWATDCFAYFGGRLIGGPKLWPRVSPSKTWSGTLTGVGLGGTVGAFAALYGLAGSAAVVPVLILSFAAAALSQGGDAFESGIKRHFGVKDSSWLIPGHGGVMDRLDGFVAAAIFALLVGVSRDMPSIAGGLFYWA